MWLKLPFDSSVLCPSVTKYRPRVTRAVLLPPPWAGPPGAARILSDRQSVLLCILQSIVSGLNDLILAAPPLGDRHTSRQMVIARASLGKDLRDQVRSGGGGGKDSGRDALKLCLHRAFDERGNLSCLVPLPCLIPSVSHSTCDVTGRRWPFSWSPLAALGEGSVCWALSSFLRTPCAIYNPTFHTNSWELGVGKDLRECGVQPSK